MTKLWQKNNMVSLDKTVETFETGDDLLLDQKLILYDLYGTMAHGMGLYKIGIFSLKELESLKKGLKEILDQVEDDKFKLAAGDEDMHTKIENFLTEKYGDIGKKVHTGRSRNDQVLTALRLYSKEKLLVIRSSLIDLADGFLEFAKKYEFVAMPGYTHMQKAMPSSLGMWAGSFVEAILDDLVMLKSAFQLNNQSPLGSAASYGVPLGIKRDYTAGLLGFPKVQKNSLYCQNSRLHIEAYILSALLGLLQTVNKIASDVLLFTTKEFGFFDIDKKLFTGSSIMPQKRNLDIAELIRSKLSSALGHYVAIVSLATNLPSGYNRDFQDGKKPLMESLETVIKSLVVTKILVENIKPNIEKMAAALTPEIFATHQALTQVEAGKAFRDAYRKVKSEKLKVKSSFGIVSKKEILQILKKSKHIGGTGNLQIKNLKLKIKNQKKILEKEKNHHYQTISKLIKEDFTKEGL